MNHVGVGEDYVFLSSYSQYSYSHRVFEKRRRLLQISQEWDNMTEFPDMAWSIRRVSFIFHRMPTKITFVSGVDVIKANRLFGTLKEAPIYSVPIYSVLLR